MSEEVKQPDVPLEEQKMEGEMVQEKKIPETSSTEPKKDDDAMANAGDASEAMSDLPNEKESKDTAPSANQEMNAVKESGAERTVAAAPSIKVETDVPIDDTGDSQGKEAKGDTVKLEEEAVKCAIPDLSNGSANENVAVPNEKVPEDEKDETSVRTDTHSTDTESSKEQEELKSKDRSPHVELSGSTTESMDTTSVEPPPSSVELTPAVNASSETKTDMDSLKIKVETLSVPETMGVKESMLTTDTGKASLVQASAGKESDNMKIDSEVKPVTDISKDIVQNEDALAQGTLQKTNVPSDSSVQNKETYDTGAVQKQETASINSFMLQESVTVDIVPKKEVLPQMVIEQSKAVHEIIAEQSSRLDRDRLVPTSVSLDRQSLNQTSASPVPSVVEKPFPLPVPLVGENHVPTSVPSIGESLVPVPVSSEGQSIVLTPVPQEKSEPAALPESTVPTTNDPKAEVQESLDDWDIPATDDEEDDGENQAGECVEKKKRKVVKRGYWEPPIDVIVDLYNKLDKDGILELTWKCPGRRPPSEEGDKEEEKELIEDIQDEEAMEISQEEDPTEFDFDMDMDPVQKMTPRRNIGSGQAQGSGKKRVARMDKVLNDIFRHRKIDSTMVDVEKKDGEGKEPDQAMDTSTSPVIPPTRPADKFHIRNDLNM